MSLRAKKIVVLAVIAGIVLLANAWALAGWLDSLGVVAFAQHLRSEYATGTAITVILALVFLLGGAGAISTCGRLIRRCPVCDHTLLRPGKYCGACGSRV
jgi:small-conductance mechanosensitive channel